MPRPVVAGITEEFYSKLGPWSRADTERGEAEDRWDLLIFCEGIMQGNIPIDVVIRESDAGDPGWSIVMDPDRAPEEWLPWLAQFSGSRLPVGLTEAKKRQYVKAAPGMNRGTVTALKAAAATALTGAQIVRIVERQPDAYSFVVVTRTAETPSSAAVIAAVTPAKPAGLLFTHIITDLALINEGTRFINDVTAIIDNATISDVT